MYLAQLSDDDPRLSLQHYQAAIDILLIQLKGKERATDESGKNDEAELKTNIVRALVGQVEIWMDPTYDLWYEPFFHIRSKRLTFLLVSNRMQRKLVKIFSPLLYRQIPEIQKPCKHYHPYGCPNKGRMMQKNV